MSYTKPIETLTTKKPCTQTEDHFFAAFVIQGTLKDINKISQNLKQRKNIELIYQKTDVRYLQITPTNPNQPQHTADEP